MLARIIFVSLLVCFPAATGVYASDPQLFVSARFSDSDKLTWQIGILPDFSVTPVGSVGEFSLEVGIEFNVDLLSATVDEAWVIDPVTMGHNPFDLLSTGGLVVDFAEDTLFLSASGQVEVASAIPYVHIATLLTTKDVDPNTPGFGSAEFGGYTIFPGTAEEFVGARIVQEGMVFDGIAGTGGVPTLFDANVDGTVNNDDIPDFVIGILNLADWQALHPVENPLLYLDADGNGVFNGDDIPSFAHALLNPPFLVQAINVPEPGSVVLLGLGCAVIGFLARRRGLQR